MLTIPRRDTRGRGSLYIQYMCTKRATILMEELYICDYFRYVWTQHHTPSLPRHRIGGKNFPSRSGGESRPYHRQTHNQTPAYSHGARSPFRVPLKHIHKQRGRPPSSEGGNIRWRNQSGMVIQCISQVFLAVASGNNTRIVFRKWPDRTLTTGSRESKARRPNTSGIIDVSRSTTPSVVKSTTVSRLVKLTNWRC